ncbi:MAG TPA: hypothetical protein VK735_39535 [Pseudonocardia sp.]|uniref:hypothetical protein n=1 Tax=Pseudonocardia sp. TaxID=60912 RepID=UPI002C9CFAB5|nr:hypothetical protein [Pseudonocardia sp.]HTF53575.1 hypothetical protein [Pseudonocardia sp.]
MCNTRSRIMVDTEPPLTRRDYPNERTIRFESPNGSGLIVFALKADGTLTIEPCKLDETVRVRLGIDPYEREH